MTGIKVTYQSTIRRFTVPNTVTWSDLESKLRSVFSLPPTFEFSLSYKDEDGDTITLSTDLELQEFITYQPPQSTLRFHLVPEGKQNVIVAENDFVSVQEERFIPDDVTEPDSHVTELDVDVTDDDESYFEPTPPSGSKGKQKESPAEPQTSAANDKQQEENQSPPSNDDNKRQAPFIDLAEQFQQLIGQFDDVISNNPQLVEQVDNIMEQILRNIPVDIDQLARWLNTFRPEGGETDHPRGEQQQRQQQQRQQQRPANDFGPFGNFSPFIPPHVLSNPWVQKAFNDVSANYSGLGNFGNLSGRTGSGCPYRPQQREEELSQEALKEKITLLHKMGFWEDDIKNEELLKKYNGNVERVVEKLIEEKYGRQ